MKTAEEKLKEIEMKKQETQDRVARKLAKLEEEEAAVLTKQENEKKKDNVDYEAERKIINDKIRVKYFDNNGKVKFHSKANISDLVCEYDFKRSTGSIQKNSTNFAYLLRWTSILGKPIWFDTLQRKIMIGDDVRQRSHDTDIKSKFESFFGAAGEKAIINKREIEDAIDILARDHPKNSFLLKIQNLRNEFANPDTGKVDITDLSSTYLTKFINAEDTEISRILQRKMGLAMVARVVKPGTYVEGSLGLIGNTKCGKTFVTKQISMDENKYYFGSKCNLESPWSYGPVGDGKVIFDLPEAGSLLALDDAFKKSFMDCTVDEYAEKNEKQSTQHPRSWCIWFSSNEMQFISDPTSSRRYWCILLNDDDKFELNHNYIKESVPRLWAEWYQMYLDLPTKNSAEWCTTSDEYKLLDISNKRFTKVDGLSEFLLTALKGKSKIFFTEVSTLVRQQQEFHDTRICSDKRIGKVMCDDLKWIKRRTSEGKTYYMSPVNTTDEDNLEKMTPEERNTFLLTCMCAEEN